MCGYIVVSGVFAEKSIPQLNSFNLVEKVDHRHMGLFLDSQFYLIDLCVSLYSSTTLFWLLLVLNFEGGLSPTNLFFFFSIGFLQLFGVPWNSIWILESACQFLFSFKSRCNWHTLYQFQVYNTVIVYIVKQSPQ